MREIKFRGKRADNGEWVYGFFYAYLGEVSIIDVGFGFASEGSSMGFSLPEVVRVDPATVGQFTGLKDKNGKEIYEGDLLRFPAKNDWEKTNYVSYEVFFHDNDCADRHVGWQMNRVHFHGAIAGASILATFLPKWTEEMEIEGNIHDNPDLLAKGAV